MLKINLVQLDFRKMSEQQWKDLFSVRAVFQREIQPDEPMPSFEQMKQSLSKIPEHRDQVTFWLIYDDYANCVGFCSIQHPKPESPDYEANRHRIYVEPVVLAPYRRQGVATQLLPRIVQYGQTVGASWVEWDTQFEGGFAFSEKLGAQEAGRFQTNRLVVEQLDWDLMQRWVDEGCSRNPGVELIRFTNLPTPDLIEPYCDLITTINRLHPRDEVEGISFTLTPAEFEKEVRQQIAEKMECVVYCTRGTDLILSGMTNMFYSQEHPTHARVSETGVRREYQGRGLGKWLKAAILLDLRERYPSVKYVDTNNFNSNAPMLSINTRMGFQLYEQFVFYKISVQDLAARIINIS